MIVIIDYGMGNLGSIFNMLKKVGAKAKVTADLGEIAAAEKLILPGVGAFDNGMNRIKEMNLTALLHQRVMEDKIPILGVCLGMQLFTRSSQEGTSPGLGWIEAETVRFNFETAKNSLKIPHMGWNLINIKQESPLFNGLHDEPRFYFVHSYHAVCHNKNNILTETFYGYNFVSSFVNDNIIGVQFHPEKSHKYGMRFLKNFVEYY
jgi:glutamine amidotransferase